VSAAPLIPRRTSGALRRCVHEVYRAGWLKGLWQGALLASMLIFLLIEGARRLT
jgi:hypothetical protein